VIIAEIAEERRFAELSRYRRPAAPTARVPGEARATGLSL
jgi:hypothetical protein